MKPGINCDQVPTFSSIDADSNRNLSLKEWSQYSWDGEKLEVIGFQLLDADADGNLTMDEWNKWLEGPELHRCQAIPVENLSASETDVLNGACPFHAHCAE